MARAMPKKRKMMDADETGGGGRLSYQQRKAMPSSEFAIPSNKTAKNPAGKGAYPIEDASHARNALARVSRFGTPAEKAKVRSAVHRRYPGIGKGKK